MEQIYEIGKICSEIQFEFILNSKDISIAMFNIELLNGSIIKVKAYMITVYYPDIDKWEKSMKNRRKE